ncbi:MAG: hypothetical protein H6730_14025 [Deltaproteobacteria bacterium]|nr:hypothetical protein [Deltaproteobacteria bacterium]
MRHRALKTTLSCLGAVLIASVLCACGQTGDLVITYLQSGQPSSGNDVYVAADQATFDRNEYDYTDRTDSAGVVSFTELEPGKYFYEVAGEGPTGLFDLIEGTADVVAGETTQVTVTGGRQ